MKKIIIMLLVFAVGSSVIAAPKSTSKKSGSVSMSDDTGMRLRFLSEDGSPYDNTTRSRNMLGLKYQANQRLFAKATLIQNSIWSGQIPGTSNDSIRLNESYLGFRWNKRLNILVGRFSMDVFDGNFIATNDFENYRTASDGLSFTYDLSQRLSLSTWSNGNVSNRSNGIRNIGDVTKTHGLMLSSDDLMMSGERKNSRMPLLSGSLFVAKQLVQDRRGQLEKTMRYGVNARATLYRANVRGSYITERGSDSDDITVSSSMMDVEMSTLIRLSSLGRHSINIFAGYHSDSGASEDSSRAYDGFLYDRHNNAGHMDLFEWGNLTYFKVGTEVTFATKIPLIAKIQYHKFSKTEEGSSDLVGLSNQLDSVDGNESLGSELDISISTNYGGFLNVSLVYGMFSLGDGLQFVDTSRDADKLSQFWLQTELTF